jgi:hypothetical protein
MSFSLKKVWNDYGIGAIIVLLIVAYGVYALANYLSNKGSYRYEANQMMQGQYKNGKMNMNNMNMNMNQGVRPANPLGQNEVFASVNGMQTSMPGMPPSCSQSNIQNPSELLPKDTNSQWAQLNPSGKGELGSINLLKAGYHIGIDTIGQSLRNANLQIRSEPPNPQLSVGPWNNTTIQPDFMRPPLEIGSGAQ